MEITLELLLVPTMTVLVLHNCLLEIGSVGVYGEAKLLTMQWPAAETKDLQQASPSSTFPQQLLPPMRPPL